jgi:hypothetical protein
MLFYEFNELPCFKIGRNEFHDVNARAETIARDRYPVRSGALTGAMR